ncbi:MAG: sugar transferase [Micropruina sp.]|nr:sugar transferase [Micropruina sp.]
MARTISYRGDTEVALLEELNTSSTRRGLGTAGPVDDQPLHTKRRQPHTTTDKHWWSPLLRDGTRPLFIASDVCALVVAALLSPSRPLLAALYGLTVLMAAAAAGLYRSQLNQSTLDDLPRLLRIWLVSTALMVLSAQLLLHEFVGVWLAAWALVLLVALRLVATLVVRLLRGTGLIAHATIIVGADATGRMIARKIAENPQCGLKTIGFLDDERVSPSDLPMLGGPKDLDQALLDHQPRALIVAQSHLTEEQLIAMIRACHRHYCEVFVLPRLYEVSNVGEDTDLLAGMPLIRLPRRAYRTWSWAAKRALDMLLSAFALVVLSPLMALIALAVRLEGGKGIIFRQERVSVDGQRFQVLKFRSMRPVDERESQTQWNISSDDRVGPVGRFIRATSLDELPQLWNILRGDMSIVGPRPERPFYVAKFAQTYGGYDMRHRVPCGLTGWAQVHGLRGDTSISERAQFDNFYIENWSLWLDVKIILMTFTSVFSKPGS